MGGFPRSAFSMANIQGLAAPARCPTLYVLKCQTRSRFLWGSFLKTSRPINDIHHFNCRVKRHFRSLHNQWLNPPTFWNLKLS